MWNPDSILSAFGAGRSRLVAEDDKLIEHTQVDLEPILENVAQQREMNSTYGGARMNRNLVPVAEIPMTEWVKACKIEEHNNPEYWRRWVNRAENKPFRITDGKL